MQFYTYQYLLDNQTKFPYTRIIVITVLAVTFIALLIRYFWDKGDVKYKDLAVIVGTMLILTAAIQFNDYTNLKTNTQKSGQEVSLVKDVARRLKIKPQKLSVNSTQTDNGDILVKSPHGYYRIIFNSDNSAYVLEKVSLKSLKVEVKGE